MCQSSTQKVDSIIAENPDKTLDELLASRKINADQKVQAEKKPALKANLDQLEEQLEHYKKFDEDYQKKFAAEKTSLEAAHLEELENIKNSANLEAKAEVQKTTREKLLALSRFLRAAAAKRQDGDETAEENRAFEGALLLIYGGDSSAVEAMEKLIEGSEDLVPTVEGQASNFTCKTLIFVAFRPLLTLAQTSMFETPLSRTLRLHTPQRKLGSTMFLLRLSPSKHNPWKKSQSQPRPTQLSRMLA